MINWKDTTCSGRYTGTDSLPVTVKKVDGCMTDVSDTVSCPISSYGKPLTINGTGIVGYIQQLSKIGKQVSRPPMSSSEYFWGLTLNWMSPELYPTIICPSPNRDLTLIRLGSCLRLRLDMRDDPKLDNFNLTNQCWRHGLLPSWFVFSEKPSITYCSLYGTVTSVAYSSVSNSYSCTPALGKHTTLRLICSLNMASSSSGDGYMKVIKTVKQALCAPGQNY